MDTAKRAVITLSPKCAETTRELAAQLDITMPQAVRQGLALLKLAANLPDGAWLAVVNTDKSIDRVLMLGD